MLESDHWYDSEPASMGLTFIETMSSIFRGHIPDHAVRTASPVAVAAGALMGVVAAAAFAISLFAAALWVTAWLAIRLL